ncbi:MAG TPA: hypothetical protein PLT66_08470 [Bacillota bacterium]|nr:hypothetical protein [Bacillota bacterium]
MPQCTQCARELTTDEIGLYKKMVNRGAKSFLCISCLAAKFSCTEQELSERIIYYRSSGCTLFATKTSSGTEKSRN